MNLFFLENNKKNTLAFSFCVFVREWLSKQDKRKQISRVHFWFSVNFSADTQIEIS